MTMTMMTPAPTPPPPPEDATTVGGVIAETVVETPRAASEFCITVGLARTPLDRAVEMVVAAAWFGAVISAATMTEPAVRVRLTSLGATVVIPAATAAATRTALIEACAKAP